MLDEIRAAWPDLSVTEEQVAEFRRAYASLDGLRAGDLYLAWACARGDASALKIIDRMLRELEHALLGTGNPRETIAETIQIVRGQLLVGEKPAIATYAGRGDLRAWLRVVATRELVRVAGAAKQTNQLATGELDRIADDRSDPELEHLRRTYGEAMAQAIRESLAALDDKQRRILRYSVIERMSIDDIGAIYRVHRATAARWVADARAALSEGSRSRIKERLGVSDTELRSIARLVESQLDVSVARLLS